MAWFGKKQEKKELLPDLPESNPNELPRLPEFKDNLSQINPPNEQKENQLPPLPNTNQLPPLPNTVPNTLPNTNVNNEFNQQAIKQAVTSNEMQKSNFAPMIHEEPLPPPNLPQPKLKSKPITAEPVKMIEENDFPKTIELTHKTQGFTRPSTKKIEPIYIRLDKFETTVQTFEEIKSKITEIEKLLAKTKEIKEREEKELEEWEREMEIIKSRINSIDKNIFNRLD